MHHKVTFYCLFIFSVLTYYDYMCTTMEYRTCPYFRKPYDEETAKSFRFKRPPECPVFEPTNEEFENPMQYISKIREVAEKFGICKIKPPADWQPPFAVDVDKFKFTPRIQRLNELEAQTRVKLNFLDQIATYWRLQGIPLKIPTVEKRTLDLYVLYNLVRANGGLASMDKERKWNRISIAMGFDPNKSLPQILRLHYMKILHPFDVFRKLKLIKTEEEKEAKKENIFKTENGQEERTIKMEEGKCGKRPIEVVVLSDDEDEEEAAKKRRESEGDKGSGPEGAVSDGGGENGRKVKTDEDVMVEMEGTSYTPHGILSRQAIKPPNGRYNRRSGNCFGKSDGEEYPVKDENEDIKEEFKLKNKELQRLAFFGAGPKLPGYDPSMKSCETKTRGRKVNYFDPLDKYTCKTCSKGDKEEQILLCDGCDDSYHTHCLMPPLLQVPEGDWRCPQCVALEVGKPVEAFGFEQAPCEYTLQQFGEIADEFKNKYFKKHGYDVTTSEVEKEFWRVVSCIDEDVTVQYGADLHTMDHGSGFPTNITDDETLAMELEYSKSPWNLNNLPVCDGSVLQYIDSDISGMKVPWMYVGMCFATFCWHNEDHWNYSINYLHWGEPKTWYGIPGSQAPLLEETMRSVAPELFQDQPDLLQQLVTIMNPNLLMEHNVQVVRTDQQAGEFVITFPRAYHAGFNQGYNFAEAVNFAPADWLKVGRECVEHYSSMRRYCVFSHDELVVRMAEQPDRLSRKVAEATLSDMIVMVRAEKAERKKLMNWGVTAAKNYQFELLADDDRVCDTCKTTVYLSGVSCECQHGGPKHTCLKHYKLLCSCPPSSHILRFRYSLDQLLAYLQRLKNRIERGSLNGKPGNPVRCD